MDPCGCAWGGTLLLNVIVRLFLRCWLINRWSIGWQSGAARPCMPP